MKIEQELIHKALGHKIRLFIMNELNNATLKKSVGTITEQCKHFGLTDPAISQHLRKLEHWGLLKHEKKGRIIFYSIPHMMKSTLKNYLTTGVK